jgi:hypothetical protein
MRHLGWLHATPDGSKKSRLSLFKERDEDSTFIILPEVGSAGYLTRLLSEAGMYSSNGMGAQPLSWQEIEAWLKCTELNLTVWEKLIIKEMSEAYVGEYSQASAKDRSAPYLHVPEEIDRTAVANKVLSAFRSFMRKKPEPDNDDSTEI